MKLSKLALIAAVACGVHSSNVFAAQNDIQLISHCAGACDCGEPVCGCESVGATADCDNSCAAPGCDSVGCDGGCDSGCGCGSGCGLGLFDCDLGDPWQLFGERCGWSAGGWVQVGTHSSALPLFNSRPDEVQLHQAWLYAEKAIDTSNGFDLGGRIDYLYGTDSQDTQAFGTGQRGWDNTWDNGTDYGHAIPQLYVEAGYGDLSVKAGHFYTLIGYEVVQATGNFFYSHAYTMYNSEPFTHTGVLAKYNVSEDLTAYGGYVLGWDSGFDDNGDAFLGGLSAQMTDDLNVTYASIFGRFGEARFGGVEKGYMQSVVANYSATDKLNYIFQTDWLDSEDATDAQVRDTFDINQYLIYSINDCLSAGTRLEWYNAKAGVLNGNDNDIYALTGGINYKPHANVVIRPEIRRDWVFGADATGILQDDQRDQTTFGIDTIFTF